MTDLQGLDEDDAWLDQAHTGARDGLLFCQALILVFWFCWLCFCMAFLA